MVTVSLLSGAAGTEYASSFSLPQTQSAEATRLLQAASPKVSGDTEQIVFATSGGAAARRGRGGPAWLRTGGNRLAVSYGLAATGRTIAAALIMILINMAIVPASFSSSAGPAGGSRRA